MDLDYLSGNKRKSHKKRKSMMDLDNIFPKMNMGSLPKLGLGKDLSDKPTKKVEVHHFHHNVPNHSNMSSLMRSQVKEKKKNLMKLTALDGEMPVDADSDGIPNAFDPRPLNPVQPKKRMIYEKTLRSIYRDDKE
jgi:hypothetical protein